MPVFASWTGAADVELAIVLPYFPSARVSKVGARFVNNGSDPTVAVTWLDGFQDYGDQLL